MGERARTRASVHFRSPALWLLAAAAVLLVVAGQSAPSVHAATQVPLTASYSIIGGGGPNVADLLTYVSNGAQQVVPLAGAPTVYMVDAGTQWSVQGVLNGSTFNQRWVSATGTLSGTIAAPLTASFTYYHQYMVSFGYNVTYGGLGYSAPTVTYTAMGSPSSSLVPDRVWVDASSGYSFDSLLPGSSSAERWIAFSATSGTVASATSISVGYDHEFLVSSAYSIIGGGSPSAPVLSSRVLGQAVSVTMTSSPQQTWFDAGANYSFTGSLSSSAPSASERWPGTVLVQGQSGSALAMVYNGTVSEPLSITPVYYHQFLVNVTWAYAGGTPTGMRVPTFNYTYFGSKASLNATGAVWVDAGTQYARPGAICCPASPTAERWVLYNSTTGTVYSATSVSSTYFHQYFESFSYSVEGQQPPSPAGSPTLAYIAGGNAQHLALLITAQTAWADANSTFSAATTLPASTNDERWFALSATGSIVGPAPDNSVAVTYSQQYLVNVVGAGPPSQWATAAPNETVTFPSFYGRSQGTGYRVTSYAVDGGASVAVAQPALDLTFQLQDGPHTVSFQSVLQYQVSLDAGASGGLAHATPPSIPGDGFWYDTGTPVQVNLTGAWGRAHGVGQRIVSISASGEPTLRIDTVGEVQAYATASLDSPVSITTTSVTQYEVVLNGAALAAVSSISPPSTFHNDTFWYDAGSPAVTVLLNGAYSRSSGTGSRTTSWELDSGAVTKVATSGPITITTGAMTSPQFINATSVTQYEVTLDAGGEAALSTVTGPSIPLDQGWYDASTPVGLVLNGAWGRSAGTGHRLAAYSIDGAPEVSVATTGLVTVLNLAGISGPQVINTTVVAQYQVTLDGGATSSLSSITPTPIPQDKNWYDAGTAVSVTLNAVWGRTATTGDRLVSYSVNQGAPTPVLSSSPVTVLSLAGISGPQSLTTKAVAQYHLGSSPAAPISMTNSTLPGDAPGWYDAGTVVKAVYSLAWNQTSAGTRESVSSYTVDGTGRTTVHRAGSGNFTVTLTMTAPHAVALTSVAQYLVSVEGPPSFTASPPSPTGDSYFDAGSKVAFTVPRGWNGTSSAGVRDAIDAYSVDGGAPVNATSSSGAPSLTTQALLFTRPHTIAFQVVTQYEVAFQFFDASGANPVQPSDVLLGVGNSTVDVPGEIAWLPNGTSFKVLSVTWESAPVGPSPAPAFEVKGAPLNVTLDTQVYPASVRAVDLFGMPVSGAQVSMTLANGTVVTGATKGDGTFAVGMIPLGTYTAKVTSLGLSSTVTSNAASSGRQAVEGRVPLSLVSLFVMVAAAAAAGSGGLLFVRRKRRKDKVSHQQ